ncbi:MAG: GreA/GreB family elongation factor [Verrucomicrobia bacterium]|nr:GreA/GreB family elongation factor [Verrucomicrobiota bacterium]
MSMQEKIILSTVSAWELGEKFETTKAQKNEALREAKIAKQDGDLSENAPYQAAKEKFRTMGRIQQRLTREMNELIAQGHTVVDPICWAAGKPVSTVELGSVAEIVLGHEKQTMLIAGARDHHFPDEGEVIPIPYNSPLGAVLLNHRAGDHFSAKINGREQAITVLRVRRPTLLEILNVFPSLREQVADCDRTT